MPFERAALHRHAPDLSLKSQTLLEITVCGLFGKREQIGIENLPLTSIGVACGLLGGLTKIEPLRGHISWLGNGIDVALCVEGEPEAMPFSDDDVVNAL